MARSTKPTSAERMRSVGSRAFSLADRLAVPSETMTRAERLIGEIEELAEDVRAIGRGRR